MQFDGSIFGFIELTAGGREKRVEKNTLVKEARSMAGKRRRRNFSTFSILIGEL
jgi:hypothetical protein